MSRGSFYEWEDQQVHMRDQGRVPFENAQVIVDYAWAYAGLAYPPKVERLSKSARRTVANATRLRIRIPVKGIKTTILLHEVAHSMTSEAHGDEYHHHGPRFVGVFMRLLCDHISQVFTMPELTASAREAQVAFNLDGPIHRAAA
jgi:hypothetical protein